WTAEQAGHLLFEIFVKILAGGRGRLAGVGFEVEFGLSLGLELGVEFRLNARAKIARSAGGDIATDLSGQRIGDWRPGFRGRSAPQRGFELLRHFRKIVVDLSRGFAAGGRRRMFGRIQACRQFSGKSGEAVGWARAGARLRRKPWLFGRGRTRGPAGGGSGFS